MSTSVREARARLADSFADAGRHDDAIREARAALAESGDVPPDALLLAQLASWAEHQGDAMAGLTHLLSAVLASVRAAPWGPAAEELATRLLAVLDTPEGRMLVARLPDEQVHELLMRARAQDASADLARLALRLAYLRGATQATEELLSSPALATDPAAVVTRSLESAWAALEQGDAKRALDFVKGLPATHDDVAVVTAFSHYVAGNLDAVEEALADVPSSYQADVVRTLTRLRHAASLRLGSDAQSSERQAAVDAAGDAARTEAADAVEVVLLRSQAMLEAGPDLAEARRLLAGFLRRRRDPSDVRWWRIQKAVRNDDAFTFVLVEMAGVQGLDDPVQMVTDLPLKTTTYLQDGAIAERLADVHARRGETEQASAWYERSAGYYESATPATSADHGIEVRQRREQLAPSADGAVALADALWKRTYRSDRTRQGQDDDIATAMAGLDALPLDGDAGQVVAQAYVRGRVLARRADLDPSSPLPERWTALPWLIVTVLGDPGQPYPAAHLVWALSAADLNRACLYFAERVFAASADDGVRGDAWLQEAVIAARFNWYGSLDERTKNLLDARTDDDAWAASVRLFVALLAGELERARTMIDASQWDKGWARNVGASVVALTGDATRARELFAALLEQLVTEGDLSGASDAALAAGRLADARDLLERARSASTIAPEQAAFDRALIELVDEEGDDPIEAMTASIRRRQRPFEVLTLERRALPVLAALFPGRTALGAALAELTAVAAARRAELNQAELPELGADQDLVGAELVEPAHRALVFGLLRAVGKLDLGDVDGATSLLDALRAGAEPRLATAIRLVREQVEALALPHKRPA